MCACYIQEERNKIRTNELKEEQIEEEMKKKKQKKESSLLEVK
jgi:hypothetical protein